MMMTTVRNRVAWQVLVLACVLVMVMVVITSPAQAGKNVVSVFGSGGSEAAQFANAAGTAVDTTTGDVYVSDQFNNRVERFDKDGVFISAFGWGVADGEAEAEICTATCLAGLEGSGAGQFLYAPGIAIDQATQQLYVVDANNNRVEKFDSEGHFLSAFGWGVSDESPELQTCTTTCQAGLAGSGDGQLSGPQGIAVDPTDGSVFVADSNNNRVVKFDKAGAFVAAFGWGVADNNPEYETCTAGCQPGQAGAENGEFSTPSRVAVDSTGLVYVIDRENLRVERFTKALAFDEVFDSTDVFFPAEIAVGPANDHVYVAQWAPDFSEQHVVEIDSTGSLVDTHALGSTATESSGLALGTGNQRIYLANGFNARVFILDDLTAPTATIEPAANVTSAGADLSGTVTPNGTPNVDWHFEISTDDANWSPVAADQDAGNGNSAVPVAQALTGLVPNTTYFVRLAATRPFNTTMFSSEIQFTTVAIAPSVTTQPADDVTPSHAVLPGLVTPNNSPTTYLFEYGTTTLYGTSVPATLNGGAASENAVKVVLARIEPLTPGTTYHFRLVAKNQAGTTDGEDQTFTTGTPPAPSAPREGIPGSGFLPDDRGWEKVSPADKSGVDTMVDSGRTRIAADGSAANFAALAGFGDVVGTGVATDYESVRGAEGWSTHAIMPPQQPTTLRQITLSLQPLYVGPFSEDLTKGVFLGVSPLTDDPNVANVANIYLRSDLRTPGAGTYQLLSACPLCASTSTPLPPVTALISGLAQPYFTGASTDYGHVIFESQQPLTQDAPSGCTDFTDLNQCPGNLYEWDHGTLRSVGLIPPPGENSCGPQGPACEPSHGSQAGQGAGSSKGGSAWLTPNSVAADGSRIFFTVPDQPQSSSGALYMRLDHTTTVQLNTSERTGPPIGGTGSAEYWGASNDGTRVFFSTTDALTDDAPAGLTNLYMYDASKPASDPHNLTLITAAQSPAQGGVALRAVLGMNSDGHYVYFIANGQLVAGGPQLGLTIYVWHDGSLRYISRLVDGDLEEDTNVADWKGLKRPTARVTPDGQHLLFSSVTSGPGPTGYDQGNCNDTLLGTGCREFYLYSYASQRVVCVSCNPSGAPATATAVLEARENTSVAQPVWAQNHPLSDDGRRVFFSTAEALVPGDLNGKVDVYEYDASTGTLHLISNGTERSDSFLMNASASGNDVLFMTRAQLVGADKDPNIDLYDARVGGGFPEPPLAAAPCSSDQCQGPASAPPEAPARGSSLVSGTTNNPPPAGSTSKPKPKTTRCRKGYVHKRVKGKLRCVKKHGHAAHRASKTEPTIAGRHK